MKKNLVLLGMMAVGKTTLGKIVAKQQGLEFIDIDARIEKKNSMTVEEIFEKKGEIFFRAEEVKEVVESLKVKNRLVALGGGAFMDENIRNLVLTKTISIWLDIDIEKLEERIKRVQKRPLLEKHNVYNSLKELYLKRKNVYKLANYKIACNDLSKKDIVKKIIEIYEK